MNGTIRTDETRPRPSSPLRRTWSAITPDGTVLREGCRTRKTAEAVLTERAEAAAWVRQIAEAGR